MSMVRIYLYAIGQKIIIPELVETEDGFFVEVEPVRIFPVQDINGWKSVIYSVLREGNIVVPTPEQSAEPGSPILEALGLKRWDDFERQAVLYTIHAGCRYISVYATGKNAEKRWTNEGKERKFASQAPLGIVVEEVVLDIIKEPEAVPKPMLLLGG
jgi:hypothetical protein